MGRERPHMGQWTRYERLKIGQFWLDFVLRCEFNVIKSLNEHVFHSKIVIECNSKLSIPQELIILMFWQFLDLQKKFFWTEARYSKFSWFGLFTTWSDWDHPRANIIRIYKYAIWFLPLKLTKMPWIYCDFLDSPENDLCQNADNDLANRCDKNAFNHHHYRLYHLSIWYSLPRRYLSTWPLSKFHVQTSHF